MSTGQDLWVRAKALIPGGNMLLSKRPELFLPNRWPTYFSRSFGCRTWDLDNIEYLDFAQMSVGACSLGYSHPEVNKAVSDAIALGNMSTLNCPEEVELAARLVDIHPWSEMVRFARTGGEANSIAIRIARAATGRDHVAICGYHGWHDWYLAANLKDDDNLEEHLLPGLEPLGVPSGLSGTVHPFKYNDLPYLEHLCSTYPLAAIKMEVQRSVPPKLGFLQSVRSLCDRYGIVLVFDECTSGFRQCFGGLHLHYGVNPDMAMFGKALGNGFAVAAVLGTRAVMDFAQSTFISSTFWTERIGSVAALKTLEVMERDSSWLTISDAGIRIKKGWRNLSALYNVPLTIGGIDALPSFTFDHLDHLAFKTYLTQEMLKKNYLATTTCYPSVSHADYLIDLYLKDLAPIFANIASCMSIPSSIYDLLESPICDSGFSRLN